MRTAIKFLRKNIIEPAAKCVVADLLEIAAPEIVEVVSRRKNFKTAAPIVGRQTLWKQLGRGSRKNTASGVIPTKTSKQTNQSQRDILTNNCP